MCRGRTGTGQIARPGSVYYSQQFRCLRPTVVGVPRRGPKYQRDMGQVMEPFIAQNFYEGFVLPFTQSQTLLLFTTHESYTLYTTIVLGGLYFDLFPILSRVCRISSSYTQDSLITSRNFHHFINPRVTDPFTVGLGSPVVDSPITQNLVVSHLT